MIPFKAHRFWERTALVLAWYLLFSLSAHAYTAADYVNAGQQFYQARNYQQALQYFNAAVQKDPNNAAALQGRANYYYAQGQYQQALSDNQRAQLLQTSPQLASFIQTLQAKVGTASSLSATADNALPGIPAEPSPPPGLPAPGGKPANPSPKKMELVLGLVGCFVVDGLYGGDYFVNPTSLIPPAPPGFEKGGYGAEAGFYFLVVPQFFLGANIGNYFFNTGQRDVVNRNNLMFLGSAKFSFGGTDAKPFLEGGLGCTYMTLSGVFSAGFSGTTITQDMPAVSFLCPIAQIGLGLEFPVGQDTDFCVETKCRMFFFGSYPQTVTQGSFTISRYYGTQSNNPVVDVPLTLGLAFHL